MPGIALQALHALSHLITITYEIKEFVNWFFLQMKNQDEKQGTLQEYIIYFSTHLT